MNKVLFHQRNVVDSWNPHIVSQHTLTAQDIKMVVDQTAWNTINPKINEFKTKWAKAQAFLSAKSGKSGLFPLAYRIEPVLSDELSRDPVNGSKFGGIPDFICNIDIPVGGTLKDALEQKWPKCSACHKHMEFLCGVDMAEWLTTIHLLTATTPKDHQGMEISGDKVYWTRNSALGGDKALCLDSPWPYFKPFWNIFYCAENHPYNPNLDSLIFLDKRMNYDYYKAHLKEESPTERLKRRKRYVTAVSKFMKENKIESRIPIQQVKGYNLRFDLDIPEEKRTPEWAENLTEQYPDIFGIEGHYQFFGRPHSQHDEARFACVNGPNLHRMAPIINWTDDEEDVSYQIYACLGCSGSATENVAFAKKDYSNT